MNATYFDKPGPMQGWYVDIEGGNIEPELIQGRTGGGTVIYDGCPCDRIEGPFDTEDAAIEFAQQDCRFAVRNAGRVLLGIADSSDEANTLASEIERDNPGVECSISQETGLSESQIGS